MTLPVDGQVSKMLFTVEEYLTDQRYRELTELLLDLAETHGRELVAVTNDKAAKSIRYLNVALHAQQIMAGFPPEGLAVCRSRLDPSAKRWYEAWQATRDESQLQRILRSAYVSRYGDNALWELGQSAWDRSDFSLAAAYWRQLVPADHRSDVLRLVYPDAEFAPADVTARLILCDIFARQFGEAERKLSQYREEFPEAQGTLAGKSGLWHKLLQHVLHDAQTWEPVDQQAMTTFGGAKERQRSWSIRLDLGPLRWSKTWPVPLLPQTIPHHPQDRGPLAAFPVVDGPLVFLSDGEAIHAWNILSGDPAWPNAQPDPSIIYPPVPQERSSLPLRPCLGTPWQTLTLSQGKLLARMGSPLTGAADSERAELASELVCLDIRQGEGKLVWNLSSDDLPADRSPWSFEGTPVVVDATAYVVLYRRRPESEFALAAIDVGTGHVQWLKSIGSARPNVDEGVNRVSRLLLTSGDGRLFLSTDQGTVLAFSQDDGRPLWALSYESQPQPLQHGVPAHLQSGLLPPVFHQGLVFAAPNDGRTLYCLEASSGRIVWQRPVPDSSDRFRHLIGIAPSPGQGRLIASGTSLWAINVHDGSLGWRLTQDNRTDGSYGQGVLTGESVFWPTREWLYQVNQRTGDLERKLPLHADPAGHSGGNLAVADGVLIIAEPNGIAVYGEYSLLKQRLELELSQRRDQPVLWRRLMDLEASVQSWDAAIAAGRIAWSLRQSLPVSELTALQQNYAALLWRAIRHQEELGELRAANESFTLLSAIELTPAERGRMLWEWAKLDLRLKSPADAVNRLHQLLAVQEATWLEIDGRPAQQTVRDQLEAIRQKFGRAPFADADRQGSRELSQAVSAGDAAAVRRIMRSYPLLDGAADVWPRFIAEQSRRRDWASVWPLLEEWRAAVATDDEHASIERQKIAYLRQAGYDRTADRLQRIPSSETPAWHYTAAGWSQPRVNASRVILPRGIPPSNQLAGVLVCSHHCALLDRASGRMRWQIAPKSQLLWAGYGETNLLLATKDELSAVDLASGEALWHRTWDEALRDPDEQILSAPDRLIVVHPERGVSAISAITGNLLWEFKLPRGQPRLQAAMLERALIIQTIDPPAVYHMDADTGRLLRSEAGPSSSWRYPPVDLGAGKMCLTTTDRQVMAIGPQPIDHWKFAGAISHAHADPWVCRGGESLALLIDGVTLVGLNPASGARLWTAGLADLPVTDPARQVAVSEGIAAAACLAQLRAVNLQDGQIAWERPLPAGIDEWRVQAWNGRFAVSGLSHASPVTTVLLMFDAVSGTPRQSVRQTTHARDGAWHIDDQGLLWTSTSDIAAWQPFRAAVSSAFP